MPAKVEIVCKVQGTKVWEHYSSMRDCAKVNNLQVSHICECCQGIRSRHKGFVFKRTEAKNHEA